MFLRTFSLILAETHFIITSASHNKNNNNNNYYYYYYNHCNEIATVVFIIFAQYFTARRKAFYKLFFVV